MEIKWQNVTWSFEPVYDVEVCFVQPVDWNKGHRFHISRCISETVAPSAVNVTYLQDGLHQILQQGFQTRAAWPRGGCRKVTPDPPASWAKNFVSAADTLLRQYMQSITNYLRFCPPCCSLFMLYLICTTSWGGSNIGWRNNFTCETHLWNWRIEQGVEAEDGTCLNVCFIKRYNALFPENKGNTWNNCV